MPDRFIKFGFPENLHRPFVLLSRIVECEKRLLLDHCSTHPREETMNSTPKRTSDTPGKPQKKVTLEIGTARQMLPLVRSIVTNIIEMQAELKSLNHEQETLDRNRRELSWDLRSRRYAITEEVARTEKNLSHAVSELNDLGVMLADDAAGSVDFPTRINGRGAAFSWKLGEDTVGYWHYSEEGARRPIPADWQPGTAIRVRNEP